MYKGVRKRSRKRWQTMREAKSFWYNMRTGTKIHLKVLPCTPKLQREWNKPIQNGTF